MRRVFYVGVLYLLFNALYCIPAFAADWEVYSPDVREATFDRQDIDDDISFEEWQDQVASSSVASRSNAFRSSEPPSLYSSYTPYDSSISTTVIQYMSDVLPKLGNVSYVLFRSGQYTYRLVYADDLQYVIILVMIPVITSGIPARKVLLLYGLTAILYTLILGIIRFLLGIPCTYMPLCF